MTTIFVVDDDDTTAIILTHLLERQGYTVKRYADGRVLEQAIKQSAEPPDLILLDVMLPYLSGFELISIIRATKPWAAVPIVMLSVKHQEHEVVRALDAGANDYIIKPFQPNTLIARLRRFLPIKELSY